MGQTTPTIYNAGGQSVVAASGMLTIPTALSSAALAEGSLLVTGTGGYEAAVSGDAITPYMVNTIFNSQMQMMAQNYATAVQLAAEVHFVTAFPLTSNLIVMSEDGAGGNIADWAATPYADFVVGAISVLSAENSPVAGAYANIKIDSSTASASATGLPIQILYPYGGADQALVGSGPKTYVVKFLGL